MHSAFGKISNFVLTLFFLTSCGEFQNVKKDFIDTADVCDSKAKNDSLILTLFTVRGFPNGPSLNAQARGFHYFKIPFKTTYSYKSFKNVNVKFVSRKEISFDTVKSGYTNTDTLRYNEDSTRCIVWTSYIGDSKTMQHNYYELKFDKQSCLWSIIDYEILVY